MSTTWTLVYATDESGAESGSREALRNAILHGADVKILYRPSPGIWWSRNCSSINLRVSEGIAYIAATFMEAADTSFVDGVGLDFNRAPFALEYHIYNTTGARAMVKFHYQDHNLLSDEITTMPMRWFVKDYVVPSVSVTIDPDLIPPLARP
jgi:hypothetical protein